MYQLLSLDYAKFWIRPKERDINKTRKGVNKFAKFH